MAYDTITSPKGITYDLVNKGTVTNEFTFSLSDGIEWTDQSPLALGDMFIHLKKQSTQPAQVHVDTFSEEPELIQKEIPKAWLKPETIEDLKKFGIELNDGQSLLMAVVNS